MFTRNIPAGTPLETPEDLRARLSTGLQVFMTAGNSGSMFPVIRGGESILVENFPYEKLHVGQFVVGNTSHYGTVAMHEIISGDPARGFIVKGRANRAPDPFPLDKARYIGIWRIA